MKLFKNYFCLFLFEILLFANIFCSNNSEKDEIKAVCSGFLSSIITPCINCNLKSPKIDSCECDLKTNISCLSKKASIKIIKDSINNIIMNFIMKALSINTNEENLFIECTNFYNLIEKINKKTKNLLNEDDQKKYKINVMQKILNGFSISGLAFGAVKFFILQKSSEFLEKKFTDPKTDAEKAKNENGTIEEKNKSYLKTDEGKAEFNKLPLSDKIKYFIIKNLLSSFVVKPITDITLSLVFTIFANTIYRKTSLKNKNLNSLEDNEENIKIQKNDSTKKEKQKIKKTMNLTYRILQLIYCLKNLDFTNINL